MAGYTYTEVVTFCCGIKRAKLEAEKTGFDIEISGKNLNALFYSFTCL
jgi:hypothetical protein